MEIYFDFATLAVWATKLEIDGQTIPLSHVKAEIEISYPNDKSLKITGKARKDKIPDFQNQFDLSKSHDVKLRLSDGKREKRDEKTFQIKEYPTILWASVCEITYQKKREPMRPDMERSPMRDFIYFECKPIRKADADKFKDLSSDK